MRTLLRLFTRRIAVVLVAILLAICPCRARAESNAITLRPWTILAYGAVDNNADHDFIQFLDDVRRAIDDDPGVELLVLIDRNSAPHTQNAFGQFLDTADRTIGELGDELQPLSDRDGEPDAKAVREAVEAARSTGVVLGKELLGVIGRKIMPGEKETYLGPDFTTTRLYRLHKDKVERLAGGSHFPEITSDSDAKLNSADATTLGRFIAWGKATAPAQRYALLIYSHADGQSMCPVERTGQTMGIAELTHEIGPEGHVDFLALELCQMGGIEIAYQWRPDSGRFGADVLVAIPNAGPPLDWNLAFARIRSPGHDTAGGPAVDPAKMSAADFGQLVIEEGLRGRQAMQNLGPRMIQHMAKESAACYDLRAAAEVKKAVDALAVVLAKYDAKEIVLALRNGTNNGTDPVMHYSPDYVDLYDLCSRLGQSEDLPAPVRTAAQRVMASIKDRFMVASFGMSGYKGFVSEQNGVFIVLPSGKPRGTWVKRDQSGRIIDTGESPGGWDQFGWYTPLAGTGRHFGNWSFLADGATRGNKVVENWFELMDSWFDKQDETGGINGYRP